MQLFLCVITPAFVLLTGLRQLLCVPGSPNPYRGYRSSMALKNQAVWSLAQAVWGRWMTLAGAAGLMISLALYFLVEGRPAIVGSAAFSALFAAATVAITERTITSHFDKQGNRRRKEGEET